ncbi:MAG: hypothetical protein ACRDPO_23945, partial [Streptosporangiaceae bacterium]
MNDEIGLVGRLRDVEPLPAEAFERARRVLRAAMAAAGNPGPPPAPAPPLPPARPRRRARTLATWSTAAIGIAAAAVAVTLIAAPSTQPRVPARHPLVGGLGAPGRGADPAPTPGSRPGQVQPAYSWTPVNRLNGVAAVSAR